MYGERAVLAQVLVDFFLRLSFGVGLTMALTSARLVTAGFFRVHLWVLMGLNTFAAVAMYLVRGGDETAEGSPWSTSVFVLAIVIAVASYVGAAIWIYEKRKAGKVAIYAVTAMSLVAMLLIKPEREQPLSASLDYAHLVTSGLLMGTIMTAMFLGHWYLNTPTMELRPLREILVMIGVSVALRAAICGVGLGLAASHGEVASGWWWFVGLRWVAGILIIAVLAWLTWQTLKIPNTQSATGILYAAVILVFIGELTSQLLSAAREFAV